MLKSLSISSETRLEIYRYLLIARPSRAPSKEKASRGVLLAIRCAWPTHRKKIIAFKWSRCDPAKAASTGIAPQILGTCKTVHREGISVLYGENVFSFWLAKGLLSNPSYPGLQTLEALCQRIYQNPAGDWDDEFHGALDYSTFPIFLRTIGKQSTASLKKLIFGAGEHADAQNAGWAIQVVTQLLKYHVPSLRQVKICRDLGGWDEFEDGPFTPSYDISDDRRNESSHNNKFGSPFVSRYLAKNSLDAVRRKQEEAMYKAVTDMVQEITWLKQLSFDGFDEKEPTYQKMKELQALVRARRQQLPSDNASTTERTYNE